MKGSYLFCHFSDTQSTKIQMMQHIQLCFGLRMTQAFWNEAGILRNLLSPRVCSMDWAWTDLGK